MSTYSLNVVDNGDGTFSPTLLRSPTVATGGTSVSFPVQENIDGSYSSTKTKLFDQAFLRGMRAALADRASGN